MFVLIIPSCGFILRKIRPRGAESFAHLQNNFFFSQEIPAVISR